MKAIDVLMITHKRPGYTRLSLSRLLETCDPGMRVWLWHNGGDEETLDVVRTFLDHPNVFRFHHSPDNKKLREPTNWFFENSQAEFLAKVDDDCLMPFGWATVLRQAHEDNLCFGAICCWHFHEDDFDPELAANKIKSFAGNHSILLNCWIAGSGYLMKRACIEQAGLIRPTESFTQYCIRLSKAGWVNGWYFPFLVQDHMDDPRSVHTMLKTDEDLFKWMPLTSRTFGAESLKGWTESLIADAKLIQTASPDPAHYYGWRLFMRRLGNRFRRLLIGLKIMRKGSLY